MRVLKFGGSSVATASRRATVAGIVRAAATDGPVAVVTSALGGVTDALTQTINNALAGSPSPHLIDELAHRHVTEDDNTAVVIRQVLNELEILLGGVGLLQECPPAVRHRILAMGERLAVPLVVEALRQADLPARAIDAAELLTASPCGTPGVLDNEKSKQRVRARLASDRQTVAVVPGFIANDGRGGTITLGRGASDLTAALLGRYLEAEAVEIWTDVDGVLSGPPSHVAAAEPIPRLSYEEAANLAFFGAKVLHPETLAPVAEAGIPVHIRNTLRPSIRGTEVTGHTHSHEPRAVTVTGLGCQLTIRAPWDVRDLPSRALDWLEQQGIRPWLIDRGSGGRTLTLVVAEENADQVACHLGTCHTGQKIQRRDGVAVVAVIGGHGAHNASAVLDLLSKSDIEALTITAAANPGEPAVALVDGAAAARTVALLHQNLIREKTPAPSKTESQAGARTKPTGLRRPLLRRPLLRRPRRPPQPQPLLR